MTSGMNVPPFEHERAPIRGELVSKSTPITIKELRLNLHQIEAVTCMKMSAQYTAIAEINQPAKPDDTIIVKGRTRSDSSTVRNV